MKFSKYISKAVTQVMALFQKQRSCLSNKATTICGQAAESLRRVPVRHGRGGVDTEIKVQFLPPTMCRLTIWLQCPSICRMNFIIISEVRKVIIYVLIFIVIHSLYFISDFFPCCNKIYFVHKCSQFLSSCTLSIFYCGKVTHRQYIINFF